MCSPVVVFALLELILKCFVPCLKHWRALHPVHSTELRDRVETWYIGNGFALQLRSRKNQSCCHSVVILGNKPDLAILLWDARNGSAFSSFDCPCYVIPESILWFHGLPRGGCGCGHAQLIKQPPCHFINIPNIWLSRISIFSQRRACQKCGTKAPQACQTASLIK